MNILVAADNVDAAYALSALLEVLGHQVSVAHDGRAAVETARTGNFNVIILDIGMPEMTGHEVARALRESSDAGDAVLIALTGWGSEPDQAKTRASGFDYHIMKPAQLAEIELILGEVHSRLSGRRRTFSDPDPAQDSARSGL